MSTFFYFPEQQQQQQQAMMMMAAAQQQAYGGAPAVPELTPVTQRRMHLEALRRAAPPAAVADDTPSRHPCKVRVPSAQKRFTYDPYRGRVTLHLDGANSDAAPAAAPAAAVVGAPLLSPPHFGGAAGSGGSSSSGNATDDDDAGVNLDAFASFAPADEQPADAAPFHHHQQQQQYFQTPAVFSPQGANGSVGTTAYLTSNYQQQQQQTNDNSNDSSNNDLYYYQQQQQKHQQHPSAAPRSNFAPSAAPWPLDDSGNDDGDAYAADGSVSAAAMPPFHHNGGGGGGVAAAGASAHFTAERNCFRIAPGTIRLALVRFKFAEELFYVPPAERAGLAVGDLVVVDGDRGENVGAVVGDASEQLPDGPERLCFHWHQHRQTAFRQQQWHHQQQQGSRGGGGGGDGASCDGPALPPAPVDGVAGRVLRRALNKDRKRYFQARRKEAAANRAAQDSVRELGLRMAIVDVEFQSDLLKLTVYYRPTSADGLVDFRQLQRALFRQYRCRIWLVNWDRDMRPRQQQQLAAAVAVAAANAANVLGGAGGVPSACVSPPPQIVECVQ